MDDRDIRNDVSRRRAEADQFAMEMREQYASKNDLEKMAGSVERAQIIQELLAKGGHFADVARLARYGAIRVKQDATANAQD